METQIHSVGNIQIQNELYEQYVDEGNSNERISIKIRCEMNEIQYEKIICQ